MIKKMMLAVLAVISLGMVDAYDTCLSQDKDSCTCRGPAPAFTVNKPAWCQKDKNQTEISDCMSKNLVIAGSSIAIIFIFVTIVCCLYFLLKKKPAKPELMILIHLCLAHLGLYIFILVSVTTTGLVPISLLVDLFLLAYTCSLLVEAIAIWLSVSHKSIPYPLIYVGVSVCCWILPAVKSIITAFAVKPSPYLYDLPDYFLASNKAVVIADSVLLALMFIATIVFIALSICLLCRNPVKGKQQEAERSENWYRINLFAFITLSCYIWEFTLIGLGICHQAFGVVFLICAILHGIATLFEFICRYGLKEKFQKTYSCIPSCEGDYSDTDGTTPNQAPQTGSPRVSPACETTELKKVAKTSDL